MLLLKDNRTLQQVLAFPPLVILPASSPGATRNEAKLRVNEIAVSAKIGGFGVGVIESKDGQLFVFARHSESQCVGFARRQLRTAKTGEQWFLLLSFAQCSLAKENANRVREACELTTDGFVVEGRNIEIVAAYSPAQFNTAWAQSPMAVSCGTK